MPEVLNKLFKITEKLCHRYEYRRHIRKADHRISESLKSVKTRRTLTKEQAREIKTFYKNLTGRNVSLICHEYFLSRTGKYSKEYMPIGFFEADVVGRANRWDYYNAYTDKNMDDVFLPHIMHPHSYLKNINGYFYFEGKPVSRDEGLFFCQDLKNVIIKPSLLSKGKGVKKINVTHGITDIDGQSLENLLDLYQKDYIIQDAIEQHDQLSALNPTSVNTIRILSYRSGMEVLIVYAVIRIGRKDQIIDNQSAGGISTIINEDGTLGKYAFGVAGDDMIEKTDTGIILEGYRIPYFDKVIEAVKRSHYDLPFFDLVGWDVSINSDGNPVLIEWNGNPGPSQTACGTGLGIYTERILKEVWPRKNSRYFV